MCGNNQNGVRGIQRKREVSHLDACVQQVQRYAPPDNLPRNPLEFMTPVCEDDGSFTCEDNYTLHLGPVAELALRDGRAQPLVSCTLHPTLYALHPTPYALNPAPYTLHPTPNNLHPTPHTLHPTPYTPHPTPYEGLVTCCTPHTPHPTKSSQPGARLGTGAARRACTAPRVLHPTLYILRPAPYTLHTTPYKGLVTCCTPHTLRRARNLLYTPHPTKSSQPGARLGTGAARRAGTALARLRPGGRVQLQGLGLRVQGLGFRVWDVGFRV